MSGTMASLGRSQDCREAHGWIEERSEDMSGLVLVSVDGDGRLDAEYFGHLSVADIAVVTSFLQAKVGEFLLGGEEER